MTVMAIEHTVEEAIRALAGVCDWAHSRDGAGFNGFDAEFGHRLAALPASSWTQAQRHRAWRMLAKYQGQLARMGLDYEKIPVPAASRSAREVSLTERGYVVRFDYDARLVADLKEAVPHHLRSWEGGRRVWVVAAEGGKALAGFALAHGFEIAEAAQREMTKAPKPPPASNGRLSLVGSEVVVRFPYDPDCVARLKNLGAGVSWNQAGRVWKLPANDTDSVVKVVRWAADEGFDFGEDVAELLDHAELDRANRQAMIEASRAIRAELPGVELPEGLTLRPFQAAGVAYALRARHTFIADEMGLGKTVQALVALEAAQAFPAVVVVPAIAKINWRREIGRWLPSRSVEVLAGTTPGTVSADLLVINYDVLAPWLPALPERLTGLVLDECHMVKTRKAQRTQACRELAKRMTPGGLLLMLSGTPVLNRPDELVSQLEIMGRLREMGGAGRVKYAADEELNRKLRASCYLRRRKVDVLPELPPKVWAEVNVEDLDQDQLALYRQAEADVVAYLAARAAELEAEKGDSSGWEAALRAEAAEHLVRIEVLKQLAVKAKGAALLGWVREFMASGEKLVLFAHHREVVDELAETFDAPKIQGGMADRERQAAVDRFQSDPDTRLIVCSIAASGVALTLTAASNVLFAEQPWTPAALDQAADRCHRIGQQDSVTAWVSLAVGTIEEEIAELIERKRVVVDATTDGRANGEARGSVLADLVVRLAKRGRAA